MQEQSKVVELRRELWIVEQTRLEHITRGAPEHKEQQRAYLSNVEAKACRGFHKAGRANCS